MVFGEIPSDAGTTAFGRGMRAGDDAMTDATDGPTRFVLVHFLEWTDKWEEWVNTRAHGNRFRPYLSCSLTSLQHQHHLFGVSVVERVKSLDHASARQQLLEAMDKGGKQYELRKQQWRAALQAVLPFSKDLIVLTARYLMP